MQLQKGMTAYFVGIGGIGMSALAQLYVSRGILVSGSDREPSPATSLLHDLGVDVVIGHNQNRLPEDCDALIYSDAVPFENNERALARERGIPEHSYFEALGEISKEMFTIAVAGSHGKTTTTAMLGKILTECGVNPTIVVGGIMNDFGSNFVAGSVGAPLVVEACEYQDHILKLSPSVLVVTNLEWDHTDYFPSLDALKQTFKTAIERLPQNGVLVVDLNSALGRELASYATGTVLDYGAETVPELFLSGEFNAMNARAAKTAARAYDASLSSEKIDQALKTFKGTWRRFEYKGTTQQGALVYDDYAHHPTEIHATLQALREKFPDKKLIVAFHPHLYSRTRDLMEGFGKSFSFADVVILAPIYAAREEPIDGITSEALADRIKTQGQKAVAALSLDDVELLLKKFDQPDAVLLTMGAGDIYKVAEKLL